MRVSAVRRSTVMSNSKIQPFLRSGVWVTFHDRYAQAAVRALNELVEGEATCLRSEQRLKAEGKDPSLIEYLTMKDREKLEVLSVTVEILCCMSVEAFLNFYGIVRLGDEFYRRNYERLGITEKLAALLATCQNVLLPEKTEIANVARKMFDRRNNLVHPKSKSITHKVPEHLTQAIDSIVEAKNRVEDMKEFFNLFKDYDKETEPIIESILRVEEA